MDDVLSIIEEREHEGVSYRAVLLIDHDAQEPYNDGGSPLLRYSRRGGAEQVIGITSYVVHEGIERALAEWADDPDLFERYCRVFHGAREFEWISNQGGDDFVTLDPADWRKVIGFDGLPTDPTGLADASEWRHYLEGEVYAYAIEKSVEDWVRADDEEGEMTTWEQVDACFGFYGYEYAEESAIRELDYFAPKAVESV